MEVDDDEVVFDAVMIVFDSNNEDDSDDTEDCDEELAQEIVAVPHYGGGSLTRREVNIKRQRVLYSHLLYKDFWGPFPVYTAAYFKPFFRYRLLCSTRFWTRLSDMTTTSVRKKLPANWDCLRIRRLHRRSDN